jgi:AraC-like DNA-binding protein
MSVRTLDSIWVPTVSARLYRPIALALEARGIDADAVFAEFGVPSPGSAGWDARIPLPQIANLWSRLLEVSADPHFPFRAAEHVDLTTCDVITYLESAASSLRGAIQKKLEYLPLITDAIEWTLEEAGDLARLTLHERPARPPLAPVAEFLIGARHVFLERFGPPGYRLHAISFRHAAPADLEEYRRVFKIEPSFGAALDQLTFARRHLDEPMRRRDDALSDILGRYAEQMRQPQREQQTWRGRVLQRLKSGIDPGIAAVARGLGVSPRTLQRALADENTTYLDVATSARRAAAEQLLRRRELGISEVAFALGFSGSPAFHRAFRRWTGTTPNEFRARELGGAFSEPLVSALHEIRRVN